MLLFFFYSIDGTFHKTPGHYINDAVATKANVIVKKVVVSNTPHLCFFAYRDINIGDELRYDYGSKDLEWRKKEYTPHPQYRDPAHEDPAHEDPAHEDPAHEELSADELSVDEYE